MSRIHIALWAVLAAPWGAVGDATAEEKKVDDAFRLPTAKHARLLSKDAAFVTIRVHCDGRVDLDRSQFKKLVPAGMPDKASSSQEAISLEDLRRKLSETRMLFGMLAKRAGKKAWLKGKLGDSTTTMEIRYEFDHRVEVGRACWVMTTALQGGFQIGWIVVRTDAGGASRGLNADAWHWIHQWDPVDRSTGPVLATVVMREPITATSDGWGFRFAGGKYERGAALRRDLVSAGKHVRDHSQRKLAIALVTSATTPIQRYVELADSIEPSGVAAMAFTGTSVPPRAVATAKSLPKPKRGVIVLDAILAMDHEGETPIETEDRPEGVAIGEAQLAKALAEFPAPAPKELRDWKRSKSSPKSD